MHSHVPVPNLRSFHFTCTISIPESFVCIPNFQSASASTMTPEKASIWSGPICGRPMRLIYDATGATMFCDRPVSLHVCRGRNKDPAKAAQNKGLWYEACTQPQPEGTHFHRWRHNLPRQQLSDDPDPAFSTFSAGRFLFQDLLNIPITPEQCSPVSSTFNPSHSPFLTPTR